MRTSTDTQKLQTIFDTITNKCDGTTFYRVYLDGQSTILYNGNESIILECENGGDKIPVSQILNVAFDSDYFFAEFDYNGRTYGIDIVKDMAPQEIFKELWRTPLQVAVKLSGINWVIDENDPGQLPSDIDYYVVTKSLPYDHTEKWVEGDSISGFEQLCDDIIDELTDTYGHCINGIDVVELV